MAFENWQPSATLPRRPCVFFLLPTCQQSIWIKPQQSPPYSCLSLTRSQCRNINPKTHPKPSSRRGQHSRIPTSLRTGRSRVWIPSGEEIFLLLYAFFWVIPRRLNSICRRFGTLYLFHLHRQVGVCRVHSTHTYLPMKMEQI